MTSASDVHSVDRDALAIRARAQLTATPRPFLRWAGSKQRLLPHILPHLPAEYGTYFEPFLGAGALFFLLQPTAAVLGDTCSPLIETYRSVASHPRGVYAASSAHNILDKDEYYRVRSLVPTDAIAKAARFIYLNRAGWNGLYRVNNRGEYNVPYGRPKSANPVDLANLETCGSILAQSGMDIRNEDFSYVDGLARAGDLVYLDPPYVTGHNNNGFIDYNELLFSWDDQVRLAQMAVRLKQRGVHVIVSNALHKEVIALYPSFEVAEVERPSTLAGNPKARRAITEAVLH